MQREGGWGFGPQMLEALAARDVGGLPSGWGARYRESADTANADTEPEPETRPEMEQLEPAAPGWGATFPGNEIFDLCTQLLLRHLQHELWAVVLVIWSERSWSTRRAVACPRHDCR